MGLPNFPIILCLEGLDGTGKSTQCRMLAKLLEKKGRQVVCVRDPGSTELGNEIRQILLHYSGSMSNFCEMSLFFAARAQMIEEVVKPAIVSGRDIVLDRFLLSTVAYQGYGCFMDIQKIWTAGKFAAGDFFPDLTVVLDIPINESLARVGFSTDRIESRDLQYHQRVRNGFIAEADRSNGSIKLVSAAGSIDDVHERISISIMEKVHDTF